MIPIEYAYVWKEEQEILAQIAAGVPEGGVIVEIGTALGGTARIFHEATRRRGVRIFSIDLCPSVRAAENLKDTDVRLIHQSSASFSRVWGREISAPIDFLYVDGDHSFLGIQEDFNAWIPFVRPGGTVAFHDYDPPERRGVVHLGVQVFLDAVLGKGFLGGVRHRYKLLSGLVPAEPFGPIGHRDGFEALLKLGARVREECRVLFDDSIRAGIERLRSRRVPLSSLSACYAVSWALERDFECLDSMARSFREFRHWAEVLSTGEHALGRSPFPWDPEEMAVPGNAEGLSRLVAAEQLRLVSLLRILGTLVEWKP